MGEPYILLCVNDQNFYGEQMGVGRGMGLEGLQTLSGNIA